MDSRREFLKKAALLSGAVGLEGMLPPSIQRALAIDPAAGTTFYDAEHIVILMQENRSFDHTFGSLRGVRGFNDPRAIVMQDKNLVWLQSNAKGETYAPFRLNINDTQATWMGSLPHGWTDQNDARNQGHFDRWLEAKKSGHADFRDMPLTLGFYDRNDLPFYYSLADAFTICDQNFCSTLTGTTSNRLYLWTGTNRDSPKGIARVRNEETDYDSEGTWKTFPERLEENGVSWKIYQNEISAGVGFQGEEDAWLGNFTDNPIEFFEQYHVRFHKEYMRFLPDNIKLLKKEIESLEAKASDQTLDEKVVADASRKLAAARKYLEQGLVEIEKYTPENYSKLTNREKSIHEKAFTNNRNDPDFHSLAELKYTDGTTERAMKVPKGDIFHQFRADVNGGRLPTVSWLVAPESFSDHPGAPWYGAWYISEAMDILTKNPEVWKKTIFILCYDENDGYFDHVPPFVAPVMGEPQSGRTSTGIDTSDEYLSLSDDLKRRSKSPQSARGGPVGLGYRVPLVIASPWSRGGAVCSEIFDHTSIIRFAEKFLHRKTGKQIKETNITEWRRTICGDLTSVFKPFNGLKVDLPPFLNRDRFVEGINKAKYRELPAQQTPLTPQQIDKVNRKEAGSVLPRQESGTRISRALPYELYATGKLSADRNSFEIKMEAGNKILGTSSGSPFQLRWTGKENSIRDYAVRSGDSVGDSLECGSRYDALIYGPNGFFRQFSGNSGDPDLKVAIVYELKSGKPTGNIIVQFINGKPMPLEITIKENGYGKRIQTKKVGAGASGQLMLNLNDSQGWYDVSVSVSGNPVYEQRFAGRVETGQDGISDPEMG